MRVRPCGNDPCAAQITLAGSSFDTLLAVYRDTGVGFGTLLALNDDCATGGGATSCVSDVSLTFSSQLRIQVWRLVL
jgi:hypothetical protein